MQLLKEEMTEIVEVHILLPMVEDTKDKSLPIRHRDFALKVQALMKANGVSVTDIKNHLGVSYEMARRYTLGQAKPRDDKMKALANMLQVSPEILNYGLLEALLRMLPADSEGRADYSPEDLILNPRPSDGTLSYQQTPARASPNKQDELTIEVSNASASMGFGIPMMDHEQTVATMRLTRAWVHSHLPKITSPDNLAVLTAYGESMSPTFSSGDMLLVDRGVRAIDRGDRVYVISKNEELYVKRVHRRFSDGAVVIKSDNPLHGPDDVIANGERERLEVLGVVVYAWNGRKL